MFKALALTALSFTAAPTLAAETMGSSFKWTECIIHLEPQYKFVGRGRGFRAAKAQALARCEAGYTKPEQCARRSETEIVCDFKPGWDW